MKQKITKGATMGYRSDWGPDERYAYGLGIKKGRQLERDDKEFDIMCGMDEKQSKIDQVIEALRELGTKIDHNTSVLVDIANRQEKAAVRNSKPLTVTIPTDLQVDAAVKRVIRDLVK